MAIVYQIIHLIIFGKKYQLKATGTICPNRFFSRIPNAIYSAGIAPSGLQVMIARFQPNFVQFCVISCPDFCTHFVLSHFCLCW